MNTKKKILSDGVNPFVDDDFEDIRIGLNQEVVARLSVKQETGPFESQGAQHERSPVNLTNIGLLMNPPK